ncbi:uncharacterized protein TRIREDRAFT_106623 [Trichoderma reesei QM6a]|uniref:Predicted protein n=2 Tax=Hypocrea jecorina TaxID=51453 RepID=G0RGX0_HYPJQ|nr:uncharacterized protein TRIREDRAFT_106623 [Trichoderma reesei QM6a]EGR49643.1 predicted protein [Trichoderma reesei QM6a]ETS02791.1 hypothetical protein M419DRAFT_77410 [Trichoderma reesei RUT C-30]
MSNLEAFGIVLHAIPILISGAELCRDAYGKGKLAFRKRKYVEKLARSLLLHQQTLLETVRLIITRSGHSYDETTFLSGDSLAYFKDDKIQTQVEAFLGDDNYRALTGRVLDIQGILEEVAKHLDGLIPSHKDDPSDLVGIIEANQTAKKHKADIIPRLKVALKSDAIKESISELDTATSTLHTFSQTVLMNRHGPVSSLVSSSNMRLAKAFRRIQSASKNLYTALCRCCTGSCHNEHNVHVLLEDRVDVASELLRSAKQMSDDEKTILAFQLIFAAKFLAPIQIRCHELSVKCMQEDPSDLNPGQVESKASRVRILERECAKAKDSSSLQSNFVPIDNLCSAIVTAHDEAQHVAFILHASNRMGFITSKQKTVILKSNHQTISLRDILSETSGAYGARLPLQSAMLLASTLGSSLLQYAQTRWFGPAWSKDSIFFLLNPENGSERSLADFNRPFVCAKIEDAEANGANAADPKSTLLELGILLLEIWHQTTLENRFAANKAHQSASDYFARLSLAAQWLDDDYNTPLPLYEQAVRYCVYGASTKRWTHWNTTELWGEICKEVIKPLSDNCRQWKGRTVTYSR